MLADVIRCRVSFEGIRSPLEIAGRAADFFSRMPYENVTKIIRNRAEPRWRRKMRSPGTVLSEHLLQGSGGTCFSLTWAMVVLLRELGVDARPALADRGGRPDGHCAVIVEEGAGSYLIDPGYLISSPVRLDPRGPVVVRRAFNDLRIEPGRRSGTFDVSTVDGRGERWRYLLKTAEVDGGDLLGHWAGTLDGPSTRSLLLTRLEGDAQIYFHGRQLLTIRRHERLSAALSDEQVPAALERHFGIGRNIVDEALRCLAQG